MVLIIVFGQGIKFTLYISIKAVKNRFLSTKLHAYDIKYTYKPL